MKPEFKLALVTGATSGIGEGLAKLFAEKGINLILSGRNLDKLNALQETLGKQVSVQTIQADLSTSEGRGVIAAKIRETAPDLVINNAGFAHYGSALNFTTTQEAEIVQVDVLAVLELTLEAARVLKEKGMKGVILNVSSAAGFHVLPHFTVYAASKAFVNSFSQGLNEELHGTGISVLANCPGVVKTDFGRRASSGKSTSEEQPMAMNLDFALSEIWKQIESRKSIHLFDWRYRLLTLFSRLVPQSVTFWIVRQGLKYRKVN